MAKKRGLDVNENEPPRTKQKTSRTTTNGDTLTSGPNPALPFKPSNDLGEGTGRPVRSNRGKGGALEQLTRVGNRIRPDLQSQKTVQSRVVDIPPNIAPNAMAPAPPKSRRPRQATSTLTKPPVPGNNPPLGNGAPAPVQHQVASGGSMFGFKAAAPVAARGGSAVGQNHLVPHGARAQVTYLDRNVPRNLPQEPSAAGVVRQSQTLQTVHANNQEIVPDSEVERTLNQGGRDVSGSSSGTDKESLTDDDDDNDDDDDSDGDEDYNLPFDPATLADLEPLSHEELKEMELDPDANQNGFNQGEPDIDENSPDEDDRRARAVLQVEEVRVRTGNNIDAGTPPFSVLDAHHKKNRKVHAPNLRDLEHSGHYHPSTPRRKRWERKAPPMQTRLESDCEAEDEAPNGESDSSDDDAPKKRAPRNSNNKEPPKPTQMAYYDPPWTDVLEDAKNEYRLHIHTQVGFQKRTEAALEDAWSCVLEAITKYNDDPSNTVALDESFYNKRAMSILIFQDGSTYRGRLKTLCRTLTLIQLSDQIRPMCDNQLEYAAVVTSNVKKLLKDGFFLRGGKDENGKTRNFGNPLIADVCKQFYYSGDNCLSALFPEEFEELPRECLALAVHFISNNGGWRQIQNCIREYKKGFYKRRDFKGEAYANIYLAMLKLMARVEADPYHGPRFRQMLKDIATAARMQNQREDVAPEDLNLDVDLD